MESLNQINDKLSLTPTIMGIEREISFINDLMSLSVSDIMINEKLFCEIVYALELSHTDSGIYELTKDNEKIFINFSNWLSHLKPIANLSLHDNFIENFATTTDDVEKSMPPRP